MSERPKINSDVSISTAILPLLTKYGRLGESPAHVKKTDENMEEKKNEKRAKMLISYMHVERRALNRARKGA